MRNELFLKTTRADSSRMVTLVLKSPNRAVNRYPGWDLRALLEHTGSVHQWITSIVQDGLLTRPERIPAPVELPSLSLIAWFEEGLEDLLGVLASADLTRPVWGLAGPTNGEFWLRRACHETAIHRWDVESAFGVPRAFPIDVAVSGIDEAIDIWVCRRVGGLRHREGRASLRMSATDVEKSWDLLWSDSGIRLGNGVTNIDIELFGSAADLWLFLASRSALSSLRVSGSQGLGEQLEASLGVLAVPTG